MMKVSNNKCIRSLSWNSLKAARTRNIIAILDIVLTTVLFTSLFTIAISLNDGFQQNNFRQAGGYSHGGFKYLTETQFHELREHPLIKEWGLQRFLGMPVDAPFHKSHVEISYSDENTARWMYCTPVEGRLPQEGTNEAATDLYVLELLGIEPEIGNEFTITFHVDGRETTQTFSLCGWWEYDEAVFANQVLIPESRLDAVLKEVGVNPANSTGSMTGSWNMDVMLKNSLFIEQDLLQIIYDNGYQLENPSDENYITIGVNWGYTGAQLANNISPSLFLGIAAALLLIIFTGYLIIYNVFQISVTNDIRFYGLLKTIGTTPKQLKRIIRQQALFLCVIGIPVGLVLGWGIGSLLTPIIIAQLNGIYNMVSVHPAIFIGATLFSLFTVLLSCARPGLMAAKVSPIEAVRYTEGTGTGKNMKKSGKGVSIFSMAKANLGRNRSKTIITILSLSLSAVLLVITVTFTKGFDMDKYISKFVCADFVVANADYFQLGNLFHDDGSLPQKTIDEMIFQGGIMDGGRVYGQTSTVQQFVTEEYYRSIIEQWYSPELVEEQIAQATRNEEGLLAHNAQIYGMERYALDRLKVFEGDLSKIYEPGSRYIAAVYIEGDYGDISPASHWAKLGDTVVLRYVEEFEYYNPVTGEVYANPDIIGYDEPYSTRTVKYRDVEYEVAALVSIPHTLSYRYTASEEFVLNDQTFIQDTDTNSVMLYAFDTNEESTSTMESFLADYTENVNPALDYESKATYEAEFEGFRSMFMMMGGALSFIVGLVGMLNFFNAILTGIIARKREFAVLQSIGMTGRQLKRMLIYEGLFYALGSIAFALILTVILSPLLSGTIESLFWFFTYQFTLAPILLLAPVFALLGCLIPLGVYRSVAKSTIVERLREVEG